MEMKWLTILMIGLFGAMFIGIGFEKYTEGECLKQYSQSNRSAGEIRQICTGKSK